MNEKTFPFISSIPKTPYEKSLPPSYVEPVSYDEELEDYDEEVDILEGDILEETEQPRIEKPAPAKRLAEGEGKDGPFQRWGDPHEPPLRGRGARQALGGSLSRQALENLQQMGDDPSASLYAGAAAAAPASGSAERAKNLN